VKLSIIKASVNDETLKRPSKCRSTRLNLRTIILGTEALPGAGKHRSVERLGCGLDDWSSIPGKAWIFFSKPSLPDQISGSPSLLSNGYRGLFPWGKAVFTE
jgi:hypothetical protein